MLAKRKRRLLRCARNDGERDGEKNRGVRRVRGLRRVVFSKHKKTDLDEFFDILEIR